MSRRELKDLNLLDDFLFGSVLTYPEIGDGFIRELLKVIFGREFGKLTIVPQKVYYGSDTNLHGTRLDVYLEEEPAEDGADAGQATVYDVEPDKIDDLEHRKALPRHVRFYHAKIDAKSLKSGESYRMLKKVVMIMITPYDPFDRKRMVYTIRNKCEEEPDMPYDDGASTLFLYTRGTEGEPTEELRQFLHYMEDTKEENVTNESIRKVHQMVNTVKLDEEVSLEYMKIFEREEWLVQQGRKEEQANTEKERKNAEKERKNAEKERENTERERRRAERAEEEVERLKLEIERLKEQAN